MVFYKRGSTEWFSHLLLFGWPSFLITTVINLLSLPFLSHNTEWIFLPEYLPPFHSLVLPFFSSEQVFTDENSAECSSAGESGAERQVPRLSLSEVVHIRTISASGDLISLQQEDEKFSKQLEKGKVR